MPNDETKPIVHMVGHAHIDPMYLWRWMEGYEAIKLTFRSALERMDEHPDFILSTSSAAFFEQLERWDPALFAQVAERIRRGQWEIVGGWWIEPDCNVPHGESFVRQALHGQRYFRAKFGVQAVVGMNPDSFGHAATLPQILAKSGCKYYMFMRPAWHEKELPANLFWWEAPDGTRVLTCRLVTYAGGARPQDIARMAEEDFYTTRNKVLFYGVGDHGGGPTKEAIANVERDRAAGGPARFARAEDLFRGAEAEGVAFPVVADELQHHAQGCYSTVSELKRRNRQNEHLLMAAEKACALAQGLAGAAYPQADLERAWRDLLFLQFHDTLGGTIPKAAYEDSLALEGRAEALAQEALYGGLQALSNAIDTSGEGLPILVYNPCAWDRTAPVEVVVDRGHWDLEIEVSPDWWREGSIRIVDDQGQEVPSQLVFPPAHCGFGRVNVLFLADVPALGYRVYRALPPDGPAAPASTLQAGESYLESARWRLELDPATGMVTRLYDKSRDLEVLCDVANRAVVIDDPSDTWAHETTTFQKEIGAFGEAQIAVLENGPVRASLWVRSRYGDSKLEQVISLYDGLDQIDFSTTVHWQERMRMLKIEWPLNVGEPTVTAAIPYGHIVRLSKGDEEPCGEWIDVSGQARRKLVESVPYGVTMLNDGKHGYDVWARYRSYGWGPGKAIMRLTALRSPIYVFHEPNIVQPGLPYPYQDQGEHTFRYAILPHDQDWRAGDAPRAAEAFNTPLVAINAEKHDGVLPPRASLVAAEPANAQVTVLKKAEDGDDWVIRCVETHGRDVEATVRLPLWDISWTFPLGHDEIKSFRVSREGRVAEVDLLEDESN